jgi:hypothetical protein
MSDSFVYKLVSHKDIVCIFICMIFNLGIPFNKLCPVPVLCQHLVNLFVAFAQNLHSYILLIFRRFVMRRLCFSTCLSPNFFLKLCPCSRVGGSHASILFMSSRISVIVYCTNSILCFHNS